MMRYDGDMMEIWWRYDGDMMEIWWRYDGGMMEIWWRYDGDMMEICWRYDGDMMEIWWRYDGDMMEIWWRYDGIWWRYDGDMMEIWWRYDGAMVVDLQFQKTWKYSAEVVWTDCVSGKKVLELNVAEVNEDTIVNESKCQSIHNVTKIYIWINYIHLKVCVHKWIPIFGRFSWFSQKILNEQVVFNFSNNKCFFSCNHHIRLISEDHVILKTSMMLK